jgi:predicted esterase
LGQSTKEIWIIFHGYGQLASRIINKFTSIQNEDRYFVAIEGLSRFYWGGVTSSQVAASWMTSQDRLEEIADFCHYIQTLYDDLQSNSNDNVKIVLFGFSQGVATLMRWVHQNQPAFNTGILWAGGIPEDISFLELKPYFKNKSLHFVYGNEDQFLTGEYLAFQKSVMQKNEFDIAMHEFEGKHVVDREVLKKLVMEEI